MKISFEQYCADFSRYGLSLNREQYEQFDEYSSFLIEYNNSVNLTAITDPVEIMYKHFLDSSLVLKYVDIPENSTIIDVGTGAGFPSVPIKIMRPDLRITLLDSLNKRIEFLRQLCDKIGIRAVFLHGRAEDYSKLPEFREIFDFSCARAVANFSVLSELCLPFVKVGGKFLSMKGPNEDISGAENAVSLLGGSIQSDEMYELESEKRRIIIVGKISQTPTKYPRNSAQIKKKPL